LGRERRLSAGRNLTSVDASLHPGRHIACCYGLLSCLAGRKLARSAEALIDTGCYDGGAILRDGRCHAEDHDGNRRQKKCAHAPPVQYLGSARIIAQELYAPSRLHRVQLS